MEEIDTIEQSLTGTFREPSPLRHDSPTPATSTPYNIGVSHDDDDDVSSSSSHTDVSSTCDVTCTNPVVHEKTNTDDEENVSDVGLATNDAATHPQIQDVAIDLFQDSNHSHIPSANDDDIERVQQTGIRQKGSEVKVKDISMTDLVPQLPTLAVSKVRAVPVSRRFYNQWARAPRLDDPEGDVTGSARKPLSMRMFTVTGSLKSYTLMKAIVRDKRSPIQNLADLFQTRYTSSPPERTRERNDEAAAGLERSLSDTALTKDRGGVTTTTTQTPEWAAQLQENHHHSFPPISADPRAKTAAPDTRKEDNEDNDDGGGDGSSFPGEFGRKAQSKLPSSVSCSSFSFDRLPASPSAEMTRKRPVSQLNPRKLCSSSSSSSFCGGSSSSGSFPVGAGLLRGPMQTTLSVNTASLLFASAVDMREQCCKQLIQKHPRGLVIKATPPQQQQLDATRDKQKTKFGDLQACSDTSYESGRHREATRVEFIDFGQGKTPPRAGKVLERWSGKKKTVNGEVVGGRPATAFKRAFFGDVDPRQGVSCERLNVRQFVTVGMTVPLHPAFAE